MNPDQRLDVWLDDPEPADLTDEERRVSRRLLTEEARGARRRAPSGWVVAGVVVGLVLGAVIEWVAR